MELLLMVGCMSLFALAVTCLAFGAATRDEEPATKAEPVVQPAKPEPARFFATAASSSPQFVTPQVITPIAVRTPVPMEALLLRIESHVRLEQAAAESFLEDPTVALLHSRTMSPLIQ